MPERRPFPPSPRRRALARQAGVHAASPILVGASASAAAVVAAIVVGAAIAARLAGWIEAACSGHAQLEPGGLASATVATAGPVLVAIALAAAVAHVAQTRAGWLPRRHLAGAPQLPADAGTRVRRTALELGFALAIGAVAFGWLWLFARRLAALFDIASPLGPAARLIASLGAALAITWVTLGAVDAIVRYLAHARALTMTAADKREDDRLAGADPRWRSRRAAVASRDAGAIADAVAGASFVVLGDDLAVAVAWDPIHRPVPARTATGRGARATQLVALARRHRVAVHRDAALAARLAPSDHDDRSRAIALAEWPGLAEIVAAVRGREG